MGTIMKAECVYCGFEKELFIGGGKMDCSIDSIMDALSENEQKELAEVMQLGATRISIDRKPCTCVSCGEIYAVPIVSYTINGDKNTICGVCPACEKKEYTTLRLCPECKKELAVSETGLWD